MTVDTSVSPSSFQIIPGDDETPTQIYDSKSNSWRQRQSIKQPHCTFEKNTSCAHSNGYVYTSVLSNVTKVSGIDRYHLEKDEWGVLKEPAGGEFLIPEIGAWQDHLFIVMLNTGNYDYFLVWELTDPAGAYWTESDEWTEFDQMPNDLYQSLIYPEDDDHFVQFYASFCGEYVLVYTLIDIYDSKSNSWSQGLADTFVMYNLDRKTWEKIEPPATRDSIVDSGDSSAV